jgi:lipid A 3-O-deacylase
MSQRTAVFAIAIVVLGIGRAALSAELIRADEPNPFAMYLRVDNDAFAGTDHGYTNGIRVGFTSPSVPSFQDPQLPSLLGWLNRRLTWLQPRGFEEYNVSLSVGQAIFTPEDRQRVEPDPLDRPYAGVLAAEVTYNGRNADAMRATSLSVGVVGPLAGGEGLQDFVHTLADDNESRGWDHELRNEPVFRLLHQRLRKWNVTHVAGMSDAIVHFGGSVGNLETFANAGVELRFGRALPDNFGSAPTLPVGENSAPSRVPFYGRPSFIHGFLAIDARYMVHDITLDGNTWRDSPSVAREGFVADLGLGFAMYWQGWKITFARYFRTKEFESQHSDTQLGSITIRREL